MPNERQTDADVDPQFPDRWSPRAFRPDPLTEDQVKSLLEAARWAPSCFNEQPWIFLWAVTEEDRERFCSALKEGNQTWACRAPLLMFVVARTTFARNGRSNRHAGFDTGAAWVSLALQARKLGLYAHAMAGFDRDKAREVLDLPGEGYEIMAAVAVGKRGDPSLLPEARRAAEKPSPRKSLTEMGWEGRYPQA